ncbi:NrdJb, partial [Pseudomonadales bacterium]|nr:NrdJb [Pseudomonadales bacterium]
EEKRAALVGGAANAEDPGEAAGYPPGAQLCKKCNTQAVVQMDGCMTCLACGDSKCG